MQQEIKAVNDVDDEGRPAGGFVEAPGLRIDWQKGPIVREDGSRSEPNGAFVETVIAAAVQRIQHYNEGEFRCRENSLAITHLEEALHWLHARTADREARGVEGTHTP